MKRRVFDSYDGRVAYSAARCEAIDGVAPHKIYYTDTPAAAKLPDAAPSASVAFNYAD